LAAFAGSREAASYNRIVLAFVLAAIADAGADVYAWIREKRAERRSRLA